MSPEAGDADKPWLVRMVESLDPHWVAHVIGALALSGGLLHGCQRANDQEQMSRGFISALDELGRECDSLKVTCATLRLSERRHERQIARLQRRAGLSQGAGGPVVEIGPEPAPAPKPNPVRSIFSFIFAPFYVPDKDRPTNH